MDSPETSKHEKSKESEKGSRRGAGEEGGGRTEFNARGKKADENRREVSQQGEHGKHSLRHSSYAARESSPSSEGERKPRRRGRQAGMEETRRTKPEVSEEKEQGGRVSLSCGKDKGKEGSTSIRKRGTGGGGRAWRGRSPGGSLEKVRRRGGKRRNLRGRSKGWRGNIRLLGPDKAHGRPGAGDGKHQQTATLVDLGDAVGV
eukprot:753710-Hanusia_phi.AAC.1